MLTLEYQHNNQTKTLKYTFSHGTYEVNDHISDMTTCVVYYKNDEGKEDIGIGTSYRNPKDMKNKRFGNKLAFHRALLMITTLSKEERTEIIRAYMKKHGIFARPAKALV